MVRQSGCQICALTGNCNAAFHNQPGQYCGSYYDFYEDNKPCCCPFEQNGNLVACNMSPTQCKCHVSTDNYQPSSYSNYNYHSSRISREYQTFIWVPLIVIFLCLCYCCRFRRHDLRHNQFVASGYNNIPVATAIPTASCPPAEIPDYHPTTNYGSTMDRNQHQSGGGGGAVASGLGGLAVGTIIGNLMGRNNAHVHHNNIQRGFGVGGYDIAGDSGDGGGYDIAGDS